MKRLLVNVVMSAVLLLMQYAPVLIGYSKTVLISVGMFVMAIALNNRCKFTFLPNSKTVKERAVSRSFMALIGFVACKLLLDLIYALQENGLSGITYFLKDMNQFGIAAMIAWSFRNDELAEKISSFGFGVAVYGAVNLVLNKIGIGISNISTENFTALNMALGERFVAPLGPGLNSFGNIMVIGCLFCVFGVREFLLKKNAVRALVPLSGALFCMYLAYRVEIRSGLIGIGFAIVWLCLWTDVAKRILLASTVVGSVLFPLVATLPVFGTLVELLTPNYFIENYQRTTSEFGTLGGRVDIWKYGFELLASGEVGWFGKGLFLRDSSPALDSATVEAFGNIGLSFHNGFVELLVVYGPLFGLFGAVALIKACWTMAGFFYAKGRREQPVRIKATPIDSCICLLYCLLLATLFEASTATAFFWSSVLLVFSVFVDPNKKQLQTARTPDA